MAAGTIDYAQVVTAAYPAGTIDAEVLRAKTAWRAAHGATFTFVSDYTLVDETVFVRGFSPITDLELRSTLVAQYEAVSGTIGLSTAATDFALFHEAGHALQRAAIAAHGAPAGRHTPESPSLLDNVLQTVSAESTTMRRLRYLGSQDELEVRLQDLNRFHALLVGPGPIMDPVDSVRALAALGMPLEYEEIQKALASGGQRIDREVFAACIAVAPFPAESIALPFEDARELLLVRRFALQVHQTCWQRMLTKILFEAPGHL